MDPAAPRRYWDAHPISTEIVEYAPGSPDSFAELYRLYLEGLKASPPQRRAFLNSCRDLRVLEIGCGIGRDARYLTETVEADYQAVDLSRETLRLAQRHFELAGLSPRFANADAVRLPFADRSFDVVFSSGVLHHVPDMAAACREAVRVLKPGGRLRVMLYNRRSWHYILVRYGVVPLLWILLRVRGGSRLAERAPRKFRDLFRICREHGWSAARILSASTDTSTAGERNYNPLSHFVTPDEVCQLFPGLEHWSFYTTDLKWWPFPGQQWAEGRIGFFLQCEARKPA